MKWIKKVAATPLSSIAKVVDTLQSQANERENAPSIRAVNSALAEKWEDIYPVGSIYMSVSTLDPSVVFGGTWQQIKDRFLLASGDTYGNGETGGAANHTPSGTVGNHTLTVNEIPSHTHSYTKATGVGNHTLTVDEIPSHTHAQQINLSLVEIKNGTGPATEDVVISNADATTGATGGGGAHNHPLTTSADNTVATGGGGAHNHTFTGTEANYMPPYLAVNVWVRTA